MSVTQRVITTENTCEVDDLHTEQNNAVPKNMTYNVPLSAYVLALRPWSFTISLTPVILGCVLAYKAQSQFNLLVFVVVCFTALSVHAAGNLVNTYYDYTKGIDTRTKSDDLTLVDGIISLSDVVTMGAFFYFMGCIGLFILILISPARMEHLALVYFGGLSGSFLYTGGPGLKYIALGDVVIFLTFGPVTVLFAYVAQVGTLSWIPLIYAIPLAFNNESFLHSKNTRDMEIDEKAKVVTLAILLGKTGSYMLFTFLLFLPYIVYSLLVVHSTKWFILPILTIIYAFKAEKLFRIGELQQLSRYMLKLNLWLSLLYVTACALASKNDLPKFT